MDKNISPNDLVERIYALDKYVSTNKAALARHIPLAEAIRQRKEEEARKAAEAEAQRLQREKPQGLPWYGYFFICLGAAIALTAFYTFGVFDKSANDRRDEPSKQRSHSSAPASTAEKSEIERVLGQVREQVNTIDGSNKERLNGIISQPGNNAERYYNAATVMFLIGEHHRFGEEQRMAYGTASSYLQEALRINPNIDQTGLRERISQGINALNFLDAHEGLDSR
jgi:hypothetical protein